MSSTLRWGLVIGVLMGLAVMVQPVAWAAHAPGAMLCTNCHTLVGSTADLWGPNKINKTKLAPFITANGGSEVFAGNHVPCLFCHDDTGSRVDMVGARQHFDGTKGTADTHYKADGTAYMISTDLSTAAVAAADPLQCINCHDVTKTTYVSASGTSIHGVATPDSSEPETVYAGYHFMLKATDANLGIAGPTGLCDQCHAVGGLQPNVTANKRGHVLTEPDTDPLKTTNCYGCHEGHYSTATTGGSHMYKDGAAPTSKTGTETAVAYSGCTAVCHNNSNATSGHGKATSTNGVALLLGCGSCHLTTALHQRASADVGVKNLLTATIGQYGATDWNCQATCHTPGNAYGAMHHNGSLNAGGTFTIGCITCHNEHGNEANDSIGANTYMVKQKIDGTSYGQGGVNATTVTFTGTSAAKAGQYYDAVATQRVCEACHPTLMTSQHGTSKNATDCLTCHSHKTATDRTWDHNTTADGWVDPPSIPPTYVCGDCHLANPTSGSHTIHLAVGGTVAPTDTTDCVACHGGSYTATLGGTHGDGLTTFAAGIVYSAGKCTTNYCHPGNTANVTWGTAASLTCNACHYFSNTTNVEGNPDPAAVGTMLDATHVAHFYSTTTKSAKCSWCHAIPATATDRAHISTPTGANDGAKLLDKAQASANEATLAATTYLGTGAVAGVLNTDYTDPAEGSATNATCSNLLCHDPSNTGAVSVGKTGTWGSTITTCTACHFDAAAPAATGSHQAHLTATLVAGGYACTDCHINNGTAYNHQLVNYNLTAFQVQMKATFVYGIGTELRAPYVGTYSYCTAGTGLCHVVPTAANNATWGTATDDCALRCHLGTADVNDFNGINKISSVISTTEWSAADPLGGHGSRTGSALIVCGSCHDTTGALGAVSAHDFTATLSGTNPYRYKDVDTVTAGNQFSCSYNNTACHPAAKTGSRTGLALNTIQTHSDTVMIAAGYATKRVWPAWDPQCVNCHDPHGDQATGGASTNYAMVQRELYDKAAFPLAAFAAGVPPAAPTEQSNLAFTNDTLGEGDGTFGWGASTPWINYSGVCQECHEAAGHVSYKDGNEVTAGTLATTGHPASNPGDCTGCHKHDGGFKPSGCSSGGLTCHGGGTSGTVAKNYWPDTGLKSDDTTASSNQPGQHVTHITVIARRLYNLDITGLLGDATSGAKQIAICEYCHQALSNDGDHGSLAALPADVFPLTYRKHMNGVTDANATFTTTVAINSCQLVDCHNNKDTTAAYGWYTTSTDVCLTCHTVGGATNDPTSGVHKVPSTTAVAHDDSFGPQPTNSGFGCTTCHTAMPDLTLTQAATHINATFGPNDTTGPANEAYVNATLYTDGALSGATAGYCSGTGAYAANCHDGAGEATATTVWKRRWTSNSNLTTGAECEGCHGGFNAGDWTFGVTATRTGDGNVDHNYNYGGTDGSQVIAKHSAATGNTVTCNLCHVYLHTAYPNNTNTRIGWLNNSVNNSTYHGNNSIELNSTVGYSRTVAPLFGCSGAAACHGANNAIYVFENSGWTQTTLAGAAGSCDACHGVGSGTLQVVWPLGTGGKVGLTTGYGSHLKALTTDVLTGTTDWNVQCNKCHNAHSGTVEVPLPPTSYDNRNGNPTANMQTILGLNYTGTPHIHLGGTSTSGATEAELCWNCHKNATNLISEFGTNTNANTGNVTYNYGTLSDYNWTAATWSTAQTATPSFTYKNRAIESTHSANFTGGAANVTGAAYAMIETNDAVATIRCSYCHDVHDMNRANGTSVGGVLDTFTGNPYLRGDYRGNPYKEDGAPQSGTVYTNVLSWGAVPRPISTASQMGGYWLDQNSASPTSAWSSAQFGGLCFLCHGTNINTMDWKTGESLWVTATNGHANSVKGGSGAGANIYDARGGLSTLQNQPLQHFQGAPCPTASGFRNNNSRGWRLLPYLNNGASVCPVKYNSDGWGLDEYGTAVNSLYHQFSCSKCHNPHASNMPKLMTTNCLDTKKNTWDDGYQLHPATGLNSGRTLSNWTSAVNCHRLRGSGTTSDLTSGSGWNKVTPW